MSRKVCIVTGSRAEYGLLRKVVKGVNDASDLTLQLISTGMHLSPEFGLTYREIVDDGFRIDRKIEMLTSSDTTTGIAKSIGLGIIGFADALSELKPDIMVVLGDRYEIYSAVTTAHSMGIPVAHIHGGEVTEGAFDDAMRHAITKMSQLHFVAAEEYRQRVIQLGEHPDHVFLTGGLGVDNILDLTLLGYEELESSLGLRFGKKNLLVTFHPVTMRVDHGIGQLKELLAALSQLQGTVLIFTLPNADAAGRKMIEMVSHFVKNHELAYAFASLGQLRYLSCMAHVDAVVGNSSSGLLEAPTLRIGTINIGERQHGRLSATSVINCDAKQQSIITAIELLYSAAFQAKLHSVVNPYGSGGASKEIVNIIARTDLTHIVNKTFYDLQ